MSRWKILLLPLAVVLAVLAYAVSATTGAAEHPDHPRPVVLDPAGSGEADHGREGSSDERDEPSGDDPDDRILVTPEPTTVRHDGGGRSPADGDTEDDTDADDGPDTDTDTDTDGTDDDRDDDDD